ncbi:hypothetical protein K7957_04980 [Sphingomonas yunnanensis]|uniref:hypothetical protein n=1 Tax=Sphingomonas yunnanensis TaxID=310400 RepID=UPI001CA60C7F|nr:hypothetical protein [Sphingomonas yunnanensis]MBY9062282.1 hypothetical protein [Sphingomonas yunnanensis]
MHPVALAKAATRFARAERAVASLEAATTHDEAEAAWNDFLTASGVVFNVLEQGAKSSPQSIGWYSRVKGERKSDPALSYLHQARNSETHGIESVTTRHQQYDLPDGHPIFKITVDEGARIWNTTYQGPDGIRRSMHLDRKDGIRLAAVTNRGVVYHPPRVHMGQVLEEVFNPIPLARAAIAHLSRLLEEAKELATLSSDQPPLA